MTGYPYSCAKRNEAKKMSMLSAAALLDELMGVDRNRAPNEKKTALHWSDPQVIILSVWLCTSYMCGSASRLV